MDWSKEERYNLKAVEEILDIKLREVLREDKGGVYGVGARTTMKHFPKNEFRLDVSFGCSPDRVDELISAVIDNINDMKNKKQDEIYITKVKEIQKREREVNLKENRFWQNTLYTDYFYNEDPKEILESD